MKILICCGVLTVMACLAGCQTKDEYEYYEPTKEFHTTEVDGKIRGAVKREYRQKGRDWSSGKTFAPTVSGAGI